MSIENADADGSVGLGQLGDAMRSKLKMVVKRCKLKIRRNYVKDYDAGIRMNLLHLRVAGSSVATYVFA